MLLDNIKPRIELSEFIKQYRIADFVFPNNFTAPFKSYPPRPQECLHFYPRDNETVKYPGSSITISGKKSTITGQHTIVNNRYVGKNFLVFQVVFQPGSLYRITGIPAKELINCYMDAEDILGKDVKFVNEQLFDAKNYQQMIRIVEKYLFRLIKKSKKSSHRVDVISRMMVKDPGMQSLDWFFKEAFLSYRQFDRMFKERIGINPKLYVRIIRFDNAFRLRNKYQSKDWLTIAIHSGYYDYQHLAKDYKEFIGSTPKEAFEIEKKAPERSWGDKEV